MSSKHNTVRVYFEDGTTTILHIPEDDRIMDAIVELCEQQSYWLEDIIEYTIE